MYSNYDISKKENMLLKIVSLTVSKLKNNAIEMSIMDKG